MIEFFGWSKRSGELMMAGMSGASRTFFLMFARGWSFLRLIAFAIQMGYLSTVSFLIFPFAFSLWRRLVIIEGLRWSWWLLLDCLPQFFVLSRRFQGKILDASCNDLHLPLDGGHGRIGAGSFVVDSFHSYDWFVHDLFALGMTMASKVLPTDDAN